MTQKGTNMTTRYAAEFVKTSRNSVAVAAAVTDALRTMNAGYATVAPRFTLANGIAFKNGEIVVKDHLLHVDDETKRLDECGGLTSIYVMRLSNGTYVGMAAFYADEERFSVMGSDGVEYIHVRVPSAAL